MAGEDPHLFTTPVVFVSSSFQALFASFNIGKIEEFNLSANRFIRELKDWELTLGPMEIRTLILSPQTP